MKVLTSAALYVTWQSHAPLWSGGAGAQSHALALSWGNRCVCVSSGPMPAPERATRQLTVI